MRKSSKFLWIALVVVAMLVVTTLGAMATDATTEIYGVADTVGGIGETFDVVFKYKNNNKNVECGKITLTWENSMSVETITADNLGVYEYEASVGKAVIAWAGSEIQSNVADGELFTVTFQNNGMAAGELVEIAVEAEDFGTVSSFGSTKIEVTANNVYAGNNDFTWDDETNAVEFLQNALAAATNQAVTVTLAKDMTFSAATEIKIDEIPTNTITVTSANGSGIVIGSGAIVKMYGQFVFDGIKYTGAGTAYSSGLLFPEGCHGTFGHENTDGASATYGGITTDTNALGNIGGHCTVYAGTYNAIAGNLSGSGVIIETPEIIVRGDASATYVVGGGFPGNEVKGASTVSVLDNASVTNTVYGGGYENSGVKGSDGATTTIDTNGTVSRAVAGSAGYFTEESTFNLIINKGANDVSGVFAAANNGNYNNFTVNITVNGGNITSFYGGVRNRQGRTGLAIGKDAEFNITINGGTFDSGVYGGSQLRKDSTHEATTNLTIKGGTFNKEVFGGSYMSTEASVHSGNTTVTLEGQKDRKIILNSALFGGSNLDIAGAEHEGNTNVYLKTLSSYATWNNGYNFDNFDMPTSGQYIYGGSRHNKGNTVHSGNSVVELRRCFINIAKLAYLGGSQMLNTGGLHSGTSAVIINGNNGLVNGIETEGRNGCGYIYNEYIVGGSNITNAATGSKQTGKSYVKLIGPEDVNNTSGNKRLNLRLESSSYYGVFGGDMFSENVTIPQSHDSEVVIVNNLYTEATTANPTHIYGGSKYGGNNTTALNFDGVPTVKTRVIVEGAVEAQNDMGIYVFGGFLTGAYTTNKTYKQDCAVILKNGGSVDGKIYLGSYRYNSSGDVAIEGDMLFEVEAGAISNVDFENVYKVLKKASYAVLSHTGDTCFKLVGGEGEVTVSEFTNIDFNILDLYRFTGTNADAIAQTVGADTVYYPFVEGAVITLTNTALDPGVKLQTVLPSSFTINGNAFTYANLIAFDELSENDNAFVFYDTTYDENSSEVITEVAHDTKYVKLGVGDLRSEQIKINNTFRIVNAQLSLGDSISIIFNANAVPFKTMGYTNPYMIVTCNGNETRIDSVDTTTDGNYYKFKFEALTPAMMGEDATAILYATIDGKEVATVSATYSVLTYCNQKFAKNISNEFRTLLVDLLNYGAASQLYLNPNEDPENLVNKDLGENASFGTTSVDLNRFENVANSKYELIPDGNEEIAFPKNATITLDSSVNIRFIFGFKNKDDYKGLKAVVTKEGSNAEYEIPLVISEESKATDPFYYSEYDGSLYRYYIRYDQLNPTEFSKNVYIKIVDENDNVVSNTMQFSVGASAYRTVYKSSTTPSTETVTLLESIIKYGDATKAWVDSGNVD